MKTDFFNPSPNVEDRREELDPIKRFLLDAGGALDPQDVARFTPPAYDVQEYLRDNPVDTPLAKSDLAEQAGSVNLEVEKMHQEAVRRMEAEARMARYRDLLSPHRFDRRDELPLRKVPPR